MHNCSHHIYLKYLKYNMTFLDLKNNYIKIKIKSSYNKNETKNIWLCRNYITFSKIMKNYCTSTLNKQFMDLFTDIFPQRIPKYDVCSISSFSQLNFQSKL